MKPVATIAIAMLALWTSLLPAARPAAACGYHGVLGDGFSAQHASSMNVAFALRDAADAGVIEPKQLNPKFADMLALHRATQRLEKLREALQHTADGASPPAFSLLLIESGMWNDFSVEGEAVRLKVHVDAPARGGAAVVTGDAVLAAIAAGRLSAAEALRRGLVVVDGPPELAQALAAALAR
jgi:hypothetical protein